jgi:hypothetical protein
MLSGATLMDLNMQNKQYQRHGLKKKAGLKKRTNTEIIYITHSDTPDHLDITPTQVFTQNSQDGVLGFKDHYIITLDGKIHIGRDPESLGFDVEPTAITILLIGRNNFTDHQYDGLKKLLTELKQKYKGVKVCDLTSNRTDE